MILAAGALSGTYLPSSGPSGSGKKGAASSAAPPKGQKSILDMFKKAPAKRRSGSPDTNGIKKAKTGGEVDAAGEVRKKAGR